MAGGIRRNSLEGETGSRPPADPPAIDRDYQIWLRRTGSR